jgi:hypothetical protein
MEGDEALAFAQRRIPSRTMPRPRANLTAGTSRLRAEKPFLVELWPAALRNRTLALPNGMSFRCTHKHPHHRIVHYQHNYVGPLVPRHPH